MGLQIKKYIVVFFQFHAKTYINIKNIDFILLQEVCNDLEVFDEFIINVQSNTDFIVNTVMPILNHIKNNLDPEKDINCQNKSVIRKFRAELLENLEKMYTNQKTKTLLMTATALDSSFFRMNKYRNSEYMDSLKETVLKIVKKMPNSSEESQSQYPATPGQDMCSH